MDPFMVILMVVDGSDPADIARLTEGTIGMMDTIMPGTHRAEIITIEIITGTTITTSTTIFITTKRVCPREM